MSNKVEAPQLTLINGDEQRCVNLSVGRTTIGRKSENTIVISDPSVSGYHAAITVDDNKVFIEDLGSTNGTFIGGVRIDMPCRLKDDTSILVGMSNLLFSMNRKPIKEVPEKEVDEPKVSTTRSADYKTTAPAMDFQPYLEFLAEDQSVSKTLVLDKTVNPLGRLGVGVAAISFGRNGWVLSPVDGLAPMLNGAAVTTTATVLKDGDLIVLGDLQVRFVA